jgi:hypothetical protein
MPTFSDQGARSCGPGGSPLPGRSGCIGDGGFMINFEVGAFAPIDRGKWQNELSGSI